MPNMPSPLTVGLTKTAFDIATLGIVLGFRRLKSWPFLTSALIGSCVFDIAAAYLLTTAPNSWAYFYTYWYGGDLLTLLRALALIDIARSFPGSDFISKSVPIFVAGAASGVGGWVAWLALRSDTVFSKHPGRTRLLMHEITNRDKAIVAAALVFLAATLVAARACMVGWSRRGAFAAHGLAWAIGSTMIGNYLWSEIPSDHRLPIAIVTTPIYIIGLLCWSVGMALPEESIHVPTEAELLLLHLCEVSNERVA